MDCLLISALVIASVEATAAKAWFWSEVPMVSTFVAARAACSGASEIEELAAAYEALLRSADNLIERLVEA